VVALGAAELTESLGPQAIDDISMGHYVPLLEFNQHSNNWGLGGAAATQSLRSFS
jgi:hypothetical protein